MSCFGHACGLTYGASTGIICHFCTGQNYGPEVTVTWPTPAADGTPACDGNQPSDCDSTISYTYPSFPTCTYMGDWCWPTFSSGTWPYMYPFMDGYCANCGDGCTPVSGICKGRSSTDGISWKVNDTVGYIWLGNCIL